MKLHVGVVLAFAFRQSAGGVKRSSGRVHGRLRVDEVALAQDSESSFSAVRKHELRTRIFSSAGRIPDYAGRRFRCRPERRQLAVEAVKYPSLPQPIVEQLDLTKFFTDRAAGRLSQNRFERTTHGVWRACRTGRDKGEIAAKIPDAIERDLLGIVESRCCSHTIVSAGAGVAARHRYSFGAVRFCSLSDLLLRLGQTRSKTSTSSS